MYIYFTSTDVHLFIYTYIYAYFIYIYPPVHFSVHRCLGERRFVLFYCPSADGFFIKYASRCDFGVRFAAPTEYVFRVRRRCVTPLRGLARACVLLRPPSVDCVGAAEPLLC